MGSRSNRREESQSKGRFTRRKEFKLTGGKGTLGRDLIERGGSSEAWYGGGGRDRTASVAGSALNPASPAPTEGASPLVCSPRRGHAPFASPGPRSDPLKERSCRGGYLSRPAGLPAVALAKAGGGGRDRTADPRLMSPLLYLLSYTATHMVCTKGHPPRQGFSQRTGER